MRDGVVVVVFLVLVTYVSCTYLCSSNLCRDQYLWSILRKVASVYTCPGIYVGTIPRPTIASIVDADITYSRRKLGEA